MASSGSQPSSRRRASAAVSRRTVASAISSSSCCEPLPDLGQRGVGLGPLPAQRLEARPAGPDVVELAAAALAQPVEQLAQARGVCLDRRAQPIGGERARLEPAAALARPARAPRRCPASRRSVSSSRALSTARRSTRPATLTSRSRRSTATCDRRSSRRRRASSAAASRPAAAVGRGFELGQALAQATRARRRRARGARPARPGADRPRPAPGRTSSSSDSTRRAGRLEPLALVLGPLDLARRVVGLGRRGPRPRARASSAKLDARSAASAAISASTRGLAGQGGQRVGAGPTTHPDGREPVAVGADHRELGTLERHVDRRGPVAAHSHHAVRAAGRARRPPPAPGAARGARRSSAPLGRGRRGRPTRRSDGPCTHRRGGEHGPHHLTLVQCGEHGARRAGALDHDGAQGRPDGRLEGRHPPVVDVDEVLRGPRARRAASPSTSAPGPALSSATWSGQRLGARLEAVTLALGAAQRLLGVAQAPLGLLGRPAALARRAAPVPGARRQSVAAAGPGRPPRPRSASRRRVDGLRAARRRAPARPARARARSRSGSIRPRAMA